ncbi:MAG: hypothetical protein H6R33_301, partial [Actinobacteria bacterium]|nr:hypothetical protein [Actinomycetota bacterium]
EVVELVVDEVLEVVLDDVLEDVVEPAVVVVEPAVVVVAGRVVVVLDPATGSSSPPIRIRTRGMAMAAAIRMPMRKRASGLRHQEVPPDAGGAGGGGGGVP